MKIRKSNSLDLENIKKIELDNYGYVLTEEVVNDSLHTYFILEEDNLQVYAPNEKPIKDVFGTHFLGKLKEIKTDEKLLNFVMVVWSGHTAIYLSYDDAVTLLPFEHPFNKEAQDKYRSDLSLSLALATLKK